MTDILDRFAEYAKRRVTEGYYDIGKTIRSSNPSLRKAIQECSVVPIIAEIKAASPSIGILRKKIDVVEIASAVQSGGAIGISIITEPEHFHGSLDSFIKVRNNVGVPLLMKDFIISRSQIEAATKIGANVVLLIKTLFERNYCDSDLDDMIEYAHSENLEVLLETHTCTEFSSAVNTRADFIGINNRDLKTMRIKLDTTKRIMENVRPHNKLIISESGIRTPSDIHRLLQYGVHAFLVGSSVMLASNIEEKVRELVNTS